MQRGILQPLRVQERRRKATFTPCWAVSCCLTIHAAPCPNKTTIAHPPRRGCAGLAAWLLFPLRPHGLPQPLPQQNGAEAELAASRRAAECYLRCGRCSELAGGGSEQPPRGGPGAPRSACAGEATASGSRAQAAWLCPGLAALIWSRPVLRSPWATLLHMGS